ncbi:hypothetical protein BH18THE2_BH18THE2_25430 [soil metagenome]
MIICIVSKLGTPTGGIIIHDHYLLRILGTVNIVKFEGNVIAACRTIYAKLFDEKPSNVSYRISVYCGKVGDKWVIDRNEIKLVSLLHS